jgi:hypothetical protein
MTLHQLSLLKNRFGTQAKTLRQVGELAFFHPRRLYTITKYDLLRVLTKNFIVH